MNPVPIDGSQKVDIVYSPGQNRYIIHVVSGKEFKEFSLEL
jgi:hypothetical protein